MHVYILTVVSSRKATVQVCVTHTHTHRRTDTHTHLDSRRYEDVINCTHKRIVVKYLPPQTTRILRGLLEESLRPLSATLHVLAKATCLSAKLDVLAKATCLSATLDVLAQATCLSATLDVLAKTILAKTT
jgi:hypothetical protein